MKDLHGVVNGIEWMVFHGLSNVVLDPPKKVDLTQNKGLWQATKLLLTSK